MRLKKITMRVFQGDDVRIHFAADEDKSWMHKNYPKKHLDRFDQIATRPGMHTFPVFYSDGPAVYVSEW